MADPIFYVYEHWRPDKGQCFYVGKGKTRRARDMAGHNRRHKFVQAKLAAMGLSVEIRIVAYDLDEETALALDCDGSMITKVCKGKYSGTKGYAFKYCNEYTPEGVE